MRYLLSLCFAFVTLIFACNGAAAPFEKGSSRLSILGSNGRAFDDDYLVIGGGYGYYPLDGLELGLEGEAWLGGDIGIYKISPQVRYVFYQMRAMQPYVGVFYRKTAIETLDDLDSVGGRAGFFFTSGGGAAHVGFGVVYESYLNCDEQVYVSCTETYPDISLGIGF